MRNSGVTIIILNRNGFSDTVDCLESLKKITYSNYKVVIVDNGSRGEDVLQFREKFGDYVDIIENDKNYGFAEGNNIGVRYALRMYNPGYVLFLNNDTVVAPEFLSELVKAAEADSDIGIVGPKIYYYDFNRRNDILWFAGGKIKWWSWWIYHHIGQNEEDLPEYQLSAAVDWVSGAAMMIKRSILEKLSLLDKHYFFGNEDVDYCLRVRKHGYKVFYVPTSKIWHKVGVSRKNQASFSSVKIKLVTLLSYYRLIRKNFSTLIYIYQLLLIPVTVFQWARIILAQRIRAIYTRLLV